MKRKQLSLSLVSRGQWSSVTLGELLKRFAATKQVKPRTAITYGDRQRAIASVKIGRLAATDVELRDMTPPICQRICDEICGRAPVLGRRSIGMIRAAWTWGASPVRGLIPPGSTNPCADVELPRVRSDVPEISAEIMRALWAAIGVVEARGDGPRRAGCVHPQIARFIRVLMLTGLRPWSELLPMTCGQLFTSRGRLAVRFRSHKTDAKTGTKTLGLGQRAAALLEAQRLAVGGKGPIWPALTSSGAAVMDRVSVRRVWRMIVDEAAEHVELDPRLYVYCARHGFATSALEAGASLTEVQAALGHTDIESTLHYLRMLPGLEGQTADRVALHVIEGKSCSVEDLADAVGSSPSMPEILDIIKTANRLLGIRKLREVQFMDVVRYETEGGGEWRQDRFSAAMKAAGIDREARGAAARLAELCGVPHNSAHRYINGRAPALAEAIKIANGLAVSLDWLTGRDAVDSAEVAS